MFAKPRSSEAAAEPLQSLIAAAKALQNLQIAKTRFLV